MLVAAKPSDGFDQTLKPPMQQNAGLPSEVDRLKGVHAIVAILPQKFFFFFEITASFRESAGLPLGATVGWPGLVLQPGVSILFDQLRGNLGFT